MKVLLSDKKTLVKIGAGAGLLLLTALVNPGWFLAAEETVRGGFIAGEDLLFESEEESVPSKYALEAPLFHEGRVPYEAPVESIAAAVVQLSPIPFRLSGIIASGDGTRWAYLTIISSNEVTRASGGMILEGWTILEVGEDFVRIEQDERQEILHSGDQTPDEEQATTASARKRN